MTYWPFYKKLAPMFNFSLSSATLYTMLRVFDVINVDSHLGRPLPPNLTQSDINNTMHLANYFFYVAALNNNSIMQNTGKLRKVLETFESRIMNEDYPVKWVFMSGHDTDIISMHVGLNFSSYHCVQELYRRGSTNETNCETGANYFASNILF